MECLFLFCRWLEIISCPFQGIGEKIKQMKTGLESAVKEEKKKKGTNETTKRSSLNFLLFSPRDKG